MITLLTAPRAHWVEESRSTCSSWRRQRAANVNQSDGEWSKSTDPRLSSSNNFVNARTASAILAFVTADHISESVP